MIASKYTSYMFELVRKCVDDIGPREPCSVNEKKLAEMMRDEWAPICDSAEIETYTCAPHAFLGFFPILIGLFLGAIVAYRSAPAVALALSLCGLIVFIIEFVRYCEFTDVFYPKRTGHSVAGVIKPRGEVKRRVIICGHTDSAYEFNHWLVLKNAAIPFMIFGVVGMLYITGISAAKTIAVLSGVSDLGVYNKLWYGAVAIAPVLATFVVFHTYKPVPGAMDDMAGVAVAAGVGKYLADEKVAGGYVPENTEVVLLGMGGEEAGLRGAKRYIEKHFDELKSIPTHAIIFDGICDEKHLAVVTKEICTSSTHDPMLIELAIDAAKLNDFPIKKTTIPLGASDAAVFSKKGISSTCILCQDTTRLIPNYHTRYDTIDNMRPESLTVSLQIAIDMLKALDKKQA